MSLVVLEDVSLAFGRKELFRGLGLRLGVRDRVGLVGPNGSGKSSLLKIIAGQQSPDGGEVRTAKGVRVGYLPQDLDVRGGITVLDAVLQGVPGRRALEEERESLEEELAASADTASGDALADTERTMEPATRLAEVQDELLRFETLYSEHEAHRILAGLGFGKNDHARDRDELSGGWRMRAHLATLLFQRPDVLLLDEPTNHLDLPSVAWLSAFLRRYAHGFVLICHDREFLDEQIDRVVSLEPEGVRQFRGNFAAYRKQRAEEEVVLRNQAKNLQREREKAEQFINRFRAQANKAKAVQSRIKQLEKMEAVPVLQTRAAIQFTFPPSPRAGSVPLRLDKVGKKYDEHRVLKGVELAVQRGDRIGIIGRNGAGKTTLLRMIASEIDVTEGEILFGAGVKVGHYAQYHAESLDRDRTVVETVAAANPGSTMTATRTICGAMLFSDEDADKPVAVLSGGERARVALARLLADPGNVMLMDEPTNHLDLESSEALADALDTFDGTLIFVSHNRAFIRRLATRIWDVDRGTVVDYPGTLDEYLDSYRGTDATEDPGAAATGRRAPGSSRGGPDTVAPSKGERKSAPAKTSGAKASGKPAKQGTGKPSSGKDRRALKREEAQRRAARSKRRAPLVARIAELEQKIETLETRQREHNLALADPAVYEDEPRRRTLLDEYQRDAADLTEATEAWEQAQQQLEELDEPDR